ncbi:amidohydrolase family protein [Streptomyces sp. KL116D]|uniref:amidohydrolase family protein n=1 Tax=Streptomyces sp. KL116D TaxID=3045152 RepID=UPI003557E484
MAAYGASSASILQPEKWREASRRLLDVTGERLAEMDAAGLDMQVLSLNAPGIQAESDAGTAVSRAAAVNDLLASVVADHPGRFAGFAALPLQDPQAAAKELERAVSQLGLRGVLVNAHTQGRYLDDPALRGVWERLEGLDVPLYLHPANGVGTPHVIEGHPELVGPMWSWGTETATHFLRLVFGGVFDDFPRARVLLGHMGEGPPYLLWRLDSRWDYHAHHGVELALGRPSEYVRRNLHITTSGVSLGPAPAVRAARTRADHVLFGTDHPFEDMATATAFLRTAPVSEPTARRSPTATPSACSVCSPPHSTSPFRRARPSKESPA